MDKFLLPFLLLLLSSCKTPDVEKLNPMEPFIEGIERWGTHSSTYLSLVNSHRKNIGVGTLTTSSNIEQVASEHAENMASGAVPFGHNGSSRRCDILITELGPGNLCGEIIAKGQDTPQEVFAAWMKSSTHKSKIENPRYTHTGVSYAKSANGDMVWVQIFLEVL